MVYRGEYLAYKAFLASQTTGQFDAEAYIANHIEQLYSVGYIKGIHNTDALQIFQAVKQLDEELELLRFESPLRAITQLFWHSLSEDKRERLQHLIQSGRSVLKAFPAAARYQSIIAEIAAQFSSWETYLDLS